MRNAMSQFLLITNLLFSSLLFGQIYVTSQQVEGNWVDTTYIVQTNIKLYSNDTKIDKNTGDIIRNVGTQCIADRIKLRQGRYEHTWRNGVCRTCSD